MKKRRLAKYLAEKGVASRRKCEELIFQGRVLLNGVKASLPQTMVDEHDKILVDGRSPNGKTTRVYFMLNKPRGYVCGGQRRFHQKPVLDIFRKEGIRLFTVGRLDKDTTGLLIVTNDGQFANRIAHPGGGVKKEYIVKTERDIKAENLKKISVGTTVEGTRVVPLTVEQIGKKAVKIAVEEGKKREIRILIKQTGLSVAALKRTKIGALALGDLPEGFYRKMSEKEKELIFA